MIAPKAIGESAAVNLSSLGIPSGIRMHPSLPDVIDGISAIQSALVNLNISNVYTS